MARSEHTSELALLEEALIILFCLIDDAYARLNLQEGRYASLKRLSDLEVIAPALFQQLRAWSPSVLYCARPLAFSPTSS
jgi:hypothetical protein